MVETVEHLKEVNKLQEENDTRAKKVFKRRKGVSDEIYELTSPLRDTVDFIISNKELNENELTYVQNELRRLSRVVKSLNQ